MKKILLKVTCIAVVLCMVLTVFATISNATENATISVDKEYIEVEAGKSASFTITSSQSQEIYIQSQNEAVCTIFDPQGAVILTSEFKLESDTKTISVSGTAPGETIVRINAGYIKNDDGTGTYAHTKDIRVVVKQATTIVKEDIPHTGVEDWFGVILAAMIVIAVIYIRFEKLNKDMK